MGCHLVRSKMEKTKEKRRKEKKRETKTPFKDWNSRVETKSWETKSGEGGRRRRRLLPPGCHRKVSLPRSCMSRRKSPLLDVAAASSLWWQLPLLLLLFGKKKTGWNLGILAEKVQNSDRNFTRGVFVSDSCPNRKVLAITTKTKQILQLCQDGHSLDQACQRLGSGLTYRHGNQATACFLTHKAGPMCYNISFWGLTKVEHEAR